VAVSTSGLLLYSSFNTVSQFTWIDRAGKRLRGVGEPGEYLGFRLAPDGRHAVASRDTPGSTDLWLLDTERGVSSRLTSTAVNTYPVWSPDGRTILFTSNNRDLFRKEAGGTGSELRLTQSPSTKLANDWSRCGRFVLYYEIATGTQRDLWILPVTPGELRVSDAKPRPYLQTPFSESWGRFSPEASPHWVAYQSDESGRYEVYIDAFPEPRRKTRISTSGGSYPQWGLGSRELFYVSPDYKLMVAALNLRGDSVEPSATRELFTLPIVDIGLSPYEAATNGQLFLVRSTTEQVPKPLTVIVNWPALLNKGAAAP
jgi:eukaryotic-like serine/threonine-protein kinase